MTEKTHTPSKRFSKKWLILGAVVVVAGMSTAAVAFGPRVGHHMGHRDFGVVKRMVLAHVDNVLDEIDATDAQRTAIRANVDVILADAEQTKKGHKSYHAQVLEALKDPDFNPQALHDLLDDEFDRGNAFAHRALDRVLASYKTLDENQRAALRELLAEHLKKH
jgi:Spy/CpxP family protein refolding chaperone